MAATSLDLSQIKTDALSSAATFRTLVGLGSGDAVTFGKATFTAATAGIYWSTVGLPSIVNDGNNGISFTRYRSLLKIGSYGVILASTLGFERRFGYSSACQTEYNSGRIDQFGYSTPQSYRLYNTYTNDVYSDVTSSTSYENLQLRWENNEAKIGVGIGSAGGTQRDLVLGSWDSAGTWNPAITLTPQGVPTFSLGTVTTSQPFTVTQTWNDGATTFDGIKINIVNTASSSDSVAIGYYLSSSPKFRVMRDGKIKINVGGNDQWLNNLGGLNNYGMGVNTGGEQYFVFNGQINSVVGNNIRTNGFIGFYTGSSATPTSDAMLYRDAANTLAQRNSTNAQAFNIYNTYTSSTSYERGFMRWNSNVLEIGAEAGSGGGSNRAISFVTSASARWQINTDGHLLGLVNRGLDLGGQSNRCRTVYTKDYNGDGFVQLSEMALPTTPATNNCRIYAKDNGLGNTQLVSLMPDGVETILAEQNRSQISYPLTWNDGATTFTGLKLDVTDTSSASASLLMDLQVGGSSKFKIDKTGKLLLGGNTSTLNIKSGNGGIGFYDGNSAFYLWGTDGAISLAASNRTSPRGLRVYSDMPIGWSLFNTGYDTLPDTALWRESAGVVAQRNSTNAQTFRLYNTYTSSTSFERVNLNWDSNVFKIQMEKGSAGGSDRAVEVWSGNMNLKLTGVSNGWGIYFSSFPIISGGTGGGNLYGNWGLTGNYTQTPTWNNAATTYTAYLLNVTDTASASDSLLMDLQVGGSSKFKVGKTGATTIGGIITLSTNNTYITNSQRNQQIGYADGHAAMGASGWSTGLTTRDGGCTVGRNNGFYFNSATGPLGGAPHARILSDGADTVVIQRDTLAQTFRVYNTYTSSTSYERCKLEWSSNVLKIGTEKGSAGGSARAMELQTDGITKLTVTTGGTLTVPETVTTPTGTTETIDLGAGNHQTLDIGSASGDLTVTLTVPSGSSAGTILLVQGITVRDITWTPSSGTIIWMGGEPTWNSDPSNTSRIVAWRWNGTDLRLAPSEASV